MNVWLNRSVVMPTVKELERVDYAMRCVCRHRQHLKYISKNTEGFLMGVQGEKKGEKRKSDRLMKVLLVTRVTDDIQCCYNK